jgi:mannitol-1-phosphate 5-dehydrogenase
MSRGQGSAQAGAQAAARAGALGGLTFVGFGLGAIQAGLFLAEAQASGAFGRLVVAEVLGDVVAAVRSAGGMVTVNVAHANRVEAVQVGPIEIYDPAQEGDRAALVQALANAQEAATAVPSVRFYISDGPGSIHRLIAAGLARKAESGDPPLLLYAAENHNHAAELLHDAVAAVVEDPRLLERICIVNTVIGKMSGAPGLDEGRDDLAPMTPHAQRAFLVEAFNRILISPARLPSGEQLTRGITVFTEKPELLPFEEAKLYVHNALHAMAGYLGEAAGLALMSELPGHPGILHMTRRAVLEESGAALVARHRGVDPLFTPEGMAAYADDLFERMVNPFLADRIDRVGRDAARKLGWEDRLVGAMRVAREGGYPPRLLAVGAAAALQSLEPGARAAERLPALWQRPPADEQEVAALVTLVDEGAALLERWRATGFHLLEQSAVLDTFQDH